MAQFCISNLSINTKVNFSSSPELSLEDWIQHQNTGWMLQKVTICYSSWVFVWCLQSFPISKSPLSILSLLFLSHCHPFFFSHLRVFPTWLFIRHLSAKPHALSRLLRLGEKREDRKIPLGSALHPCATSAFDHGWYPFTTAFPSHAEGWGKESIILLWGNTMPTHPFSPSLCYVFEFICHGLKMIPFPWTL